MKDATLGGSVQSTHEVAESIEIEMDSEVKEWPKVFSIRSAYRHEADFSNTSLGEVRPPHESFRFQRIIDQDQAVSDNFNRLGRRALERALNSEPGSKSLAHFRLDTVGKLQEAMGYLFGDPILSLQDLGSGIEHGDFRFRKGTARNFHYKNLSGGEKARSMCFLTSSSSGTTTPMRFTASMNLSPMSHPLFMGDSLRRF